MDEKYQNTEESQTSVSQAKSETQVIYCGPNIPTRGIFTYQVYLGGLPYNVRSMIDVIPEIEKLIVPVRECEEMRAKIRRKGTAEYQWNEKVKKEVSK